MDAAATIPLRFRFTRDNAREMAALANEARKAKKEREQADLARARSLIRTTDEQTEEIARELQRLLRMMSDSEDADEIQKLSAARARLRDEWQVLTGTPNPGSRKSSRKDRQPTAQPIEETPQEPPKGSTV